MNKYILCLIGIAYLLYACSQSFRLAGKIDKPLKSTSAELIAPNCKDGEFLQTTPIRSGGSFEFTGPITPGKIVYLNLPKDYIRIPMYVEEGSYELASIDGGYYILSTRKNSLQDKYAGFLQEASRLDKEYAEIGRRYSEMADVLEKAKLSGELDAKFKEKNDWALKGIQTFSGTEIAQNILNENLYYCEIDFKFFTRAIETLGDSIPASGMKSRIFAVYEKCKAQQLTGEAPGFQLPDLSGNMISLSSFRGKYVLLDFWASWCAPCREKNKELNKYYDELKSKGLEMISVSLDDNAALWSEAVKTDDIRWTQLADLSGFKTSKVRKAYKVEQVPTVYFIDPEGNIISTNPDIEEIRRTIQN